MQMYVGLDVHIKSSVFVIQDVESQPLFWPLSFEQRVAAESYGSRGRRIPSPRSPVLL
jgi:hypothetical protein